MSEVKPHRVRNPQVVEKSNKREDTILYHNLSQEWARMIIDGADPNEIERVRMEKLIVYARISPYNQKT